jgi:hypothetical protein
VLALAAWAMTRISVQGVSYVIHPTERTWRTPLDLAANLLLATGILLLVRRVATSDQLARHGRRRRDDDRPWSS